ncbi:MAG: helix-turn-helix transcriptional regulator [Phycisphaerae bacterium]|nr:helix-turn-helix transcriptional regulator [Phycisphaerae bacterium]NIW94121.1 helix-turn-helix domain-containing protein [Phycisphaerae bacterium]NIX29483.1 helix-turn-helix domain-containing protein [Phycisphaerae bacterium]
MQRFGEKLRTLRKQRKMTLKELASKLGYNSYTYINAIELGQKQPSLELVARIAEMFEVSFDQLLNDDLEVD